MSAVRWEGSFEPSKFFFWDSFSVERHVRLLFLDPLRYIHSSKRRKVLDVESLSTRVAPNDYHGLLNTRGHYHGTEANIKYKSNTTKNIYKSKSTTQYVQTLLQTLAVIPYES